VAEVRIRGERGATVVAVKRIDLWVDLLSVLRGDVRLHRIAIIHPELFVERGPDGRLNVERLKKALPLLGTLDVGSASFRDGSVVYTDLRSGQRLEATHLDLTASVRAKDGIYDLAPITMRIFGGQMVASVHADASGPALRCRVHCSIPQFRIEEFLRTLSPIRAAVGPMDFVADLSMEGQTMDQMVQTMTGQLSLRGKDLVFEGGDLDGDLARYASSQNFNLVDVGAVFFAGPLGVAVTKGYGFASLFRSGGHSTVRTLVSTWSVERGVAQARDVALATSRNRIALQGGLDFVHQRFADVTVAVIDAKGCAGVKQTIHGDFARPVVEKPHVLQSLAGPWLKLYQRGRGLFPAGPCEVFYSGSVAPPT